MNIQIEQIEKKIQRLQLQLDYLKKLEEMKENKNSNQESFEQKKD